jgi:subtilase family serine protease
MNKIVVVIGLLMVQVSSNSVIAAVTYQKLPNLIIDNITPNPAQPRAGEVCRVAVGVRNIGNETARNFEVALWKSHDGEPADMTGADATVSVTSLASGEQKALEFQITWPQGGTFSMWTLADAGNVVAEIDKTDNTRSYLIQVGGPAATSSPTPTSTPTPTIPPAPPENSNCFNLGLPMTILLSVAYVLIGKISV